MPGEPMNRDPSSTELSPSPPKEDAASARIVSVDVYRGAVMFLMMAEVLELARVARSFPTSPTWQALAFHQSHVEWRGCSVHDMIQPSFSFLVGVVLPFSIASRARRGESGTRMTLHAAWRALVLVALGIFLRSMGRKMTNFTFEDTLTQIGLGYLPLFLIALARPSARWIALGVILAGYWAAFAWYPAPGPDFDYQAVGVASGWPHLASGFAAHWNKNSNLAWAADRGFLNQFPREIAFTHNRGGYATLSFLPTLGTMLLGLIAGGWLKGQGGAGGKLGRLAMAAVVGVASGLALDRLGVCPIVKRIWTPSWVLFSGGIGFATLGALYAAVDLTRYRGWTYPLRVIGRNSIAAYVLAHLAGDFITGSIRTHLGPNVFKPLGPNYEPMVAGAAVLTAYWLVLLWMDRRRIYLKV
jgi:heparan-alpha-glucosaminide N-acetyltransferase